MKLVVAAVKSGEKMSRRRTNTKENQLLSFQDLKKYFDEKFDEAIPKAKAK